MPDHADSMSAAADRRTTPGLLRAMLAEDSGAAAAEYAVLTALVVAAVAAAVAIFDLNHFFALRELVLSCVNGQC